MKSFTLSWPQPEQPNGIILDYELRFYEKVGWVCVCVCLRVYKRTSAQEHVHLRVCVCICAFIVLKETQQKFLLCSEAKPPNSPG